VTDETDHALTPLVNAAVEAHELFLAFQEAGFTEEQAMKLVIGILTKRAE